MITIVLIAALVFCMSGCGFKQGAFLDEKVSELIDCFAAQDADGSYALIYPDGTDMESYLSSVEKIYEYFPVTTGYTMERQEFSYKKSLSDGSDIIEGQYQVEFGGKVFYIIVTWRTDDEVSGFTNFYAFNEEDWAKAQENK